SSRQQPEGIRRWIQSTSAIAALKHGREAFGIDRDLAFLAIAERRLADLSQGRLPMRPSGQPVRRPKLSERVAQVPLEWDMSRGEVSDARR
ncbi:hypothetical protein IP69_10655, partial [Bosea sp. AAP35]